MLYQPCTAILFSPTPPLAGDAMRYLSYSPDMAPSTLARNTKYIHLSLNQFMPSFLLVYFSSSIPISATSTPSHCHRLRRSAKIIMAPTSTMTGRVALIGPTIVSGRCFSPKYANSHEANTMHDLINIYLCPSHPYS